MWTIWQQTIQILNESAAYLLFGFLLAGLLNVLLSRYQRITGVLAGPGQRPVFLAAILGAPLPLCSCSVLPTALTLRKQGASKGATASFLISVPETDVISIVLTYALLGPVIAIARPVAAVITAITTGLVVNSVEERLKKRPPETGPVSGVGPKTSENCHSKENGLEPKTKAAKTPPESVPRGNWFVRAIRFGFVEMFDDIMGQLFIGIVIAGAIVAWFPALELQEVVGSSPLTYLVMLVIGIPVYVCATASTPLAVGLIAGGVSPGAAMVFLLVGPATNIASLIVLNRHFGKRVLTAYLASIGVASLLIGVTLDWIIGPDFSVRHLLSDPFAAKGASGFQMAGTVLLLVLIGLSFRRTRLLNTWAASISRKLRISLAPRTIYICILAILAVSYLISGCFVVNPGERAAVKRFGGVTNGFLGPGLHYRLPVPFGSVDIESVKLLRTVEIGFRTDQTEFTPLSGEDEGPYVSEAWMLAGDENIIDIRFSVQYQIIDKEKTFLEFMYGVKDKTLLVRNAAEWALRKSVSTRGIDALLTVDRDEIENEIQTNFLQSRLDACASGIRIVDVNLESVHAPAPVHWAFRDVASAVEDQRQKENIAREYWERTTLGAEGKAAGLLALADGEAIERVETAKGDGHAFDALREVYKEAPELTEVRLYLEWMDKLLPGMNKYVDLMPPGGGGRDVWLRMGPESKEGTGGQIKEFELPWSREQEDTP